MGTGTSKRAQIAPVATISVQPAENNNTTSLNHSLQSQVSDAGNNDSDDTLKNPPSRTSSSRQSTAQGGKRQLGSARRGGAVSRPTSTISGRQWLGKGYRTVSGGVERLKSPTTGLPFKRDFENFDLDTSQRSSSQRVRTIGHLFQEVSAPENDIIFLRIDPKHAPEFPASCCQLCGNRFTNLGIRVPLLLLCGHSYCSSCLEKACDSYDYPAALKCGICLIVTPLDQLGLENLPQNEAILDLIGAKEYNIISSEHHPERCAECDHRSATMYCSECSACYCEFCGKKAHEGSRVRARHRPVPINLKPRPQPTCKKHPGQSCVLYCETEKQPMCVLCKFYNQHRFHKFELMSKVASKYSSSISEKLAQLDQLEKDLDTAAQSLYSSVDEIKNSADKLQDRLEKHFSEMKKTYLAAMERREAMLLGLVDRQVEVKQEILAEMRMEVAAARTRVLAAREEASKLLELNPVSALLSRRHMDLSFDRALKQTINSPHFTVQPDVPLSLLPDIIPSLIQTLNQHGAILQLPPKPQFSGIQVAANNILLEWEVQDQSTDISSDRTLTFSLHCYGDIPYKLKTKLMFKKGYAKTITPESGFEDMSEMSSESKSTFPSLPSSVFGSRPISLVAQPEQDMGLECPNSQTKIIEEERESNGLMLKPTDSKPILSLLPEQIRLPKRKEVRLPQFSTLSANASLNIPNPIKPSTANSSTTAGAHSIRVSTASAASNTGGVLNLPPLIISKPECPVQLESLSGLTTEEEHMSTVDESEHSSDHQKISQTDSTSSLSDSSDDEKVSDITELGRLCQGYAFEEIYSGEDTTFRYSGLVTGASYFFKVRCHNAAGWGPWSNTVKCMTTLN